MTRWFWVPRQTLAPQAAKGFRLRRSGCEWKAAPAGSSGLPSRSPRIKKNDLEANERVFVASTPPNPSDRCSLAKGLATAWPSAEVLRTLEVGAAEALRQFAAGDVVGARKRWAEVGRILSRCPKGKKGAPRVITHSGRSMRLSAWARELGVSPQALSYRLEVMSLEIALVAHDSRGRKPAKP